jgi:hypothetical protein
MSRKHGRRNILRTLLQPKLPFQGDVVCLRVFSQVVVVLCSVSAIKDLLEKRREIYSDRPYFPIAEMYVL